MERIDTSEALATAETERDMLAAAYRRAIVLLRKHGWIVEGVDRKGYRAVMSEAYDLEAWNVTSESDEQPVTLEGSAA